MNSLKNKYPLKQIYHRCINNISVNISYTNTEIFIGVISTNDLIKHLPQILLTHLPLHVAPLHPKYCT